MKRILSFLIAGAMVGLAGCSNGGGSSSQTSSAAPESAPASMTEESSSTASETGETPAEVAPFSGFDPAASLSDEELAATVKAAYEGTGEFAPDKLPTASIETTMGTVKIRLFPQFAPKAVENFITHAKNGYYENTKFHRVIKDFMIQGGDPKGDGTGGASIWKTPFVDEVSDILHNFRGALSMANSGANTNGSQFFIVQNGQPMTDAEWEVALTGNEIQPGIYNQRQLYEAYARLLPLTEGKDANTVQSDPAIQKAMESLNAELAAKRQEGVPPEYAKRLESVRDIYKQVGGTAYLDNKHTVLGYVYEGMDVVDAIAAVETNESDAPKDNVLIRKITITEPAGAAAAPDASSGAASSEAVPTQASPETAAEASSEAASSETASQSAPADASSGEVPAA